MTLEEAIKKFEKIKKGDICLIHQRIEGKEVIEDYSLCDMAISALEKQIPKKPGYTKLMYKCNGEDIEINHPECPYCRTHGFSLWDAAIPVGDKYCKRCGQAIDWEEEG